jgi:hypothetical protein
MSTDSVIDEVRAIRDAIAREHGYGLASRCRALRERSRAAGLETVTLLPRPVSRPCQVLQLTNDLSCGRAVLGRIGENVYPLDWW